MQYLSPIRRDKSLNNCLWIYEFTYGLENNQVDITLENLAKMAPVNKTNVIFKFNMYGMPQANTYQRNRLYIKLGKLPDAPL